MSGPEYTRIASLIWGKFVTITFTADIEKRIPGYLRDQRLEIYCERQGQDSRGVGIVTGKGEFFSIREIKKIEFTKK